MLKPADVVKLGKIFYTIMEKNEKFKIFKDLISIEAFKKFKNVKLFKVIVKKDYKIENLNDVDVNLLDTACIKICDINEKNIWNVLEHSIPENQSRHSYGGYYKNNFNFSFLYNNIFKYKTNSLSTKNIFFNIDKNIKINFSSTLLNFAVFKELAAQAYNHNLHNSICQILFVGENSYFLGFITINGHLIINQRIIEKLLKDKKESKIIDLLQKLLFIYCKFFKKIEFVNMKEVIDDDVEIIKRDFTDHFLTQNINNFSSDKLTDHQLDRLLNTIPVEVSRYVKKYFKDSFFSLVDNASYCSLVKDFLSSKKESEYNVAQDAFKKGCSVGIRFEMLGWKITKEKFVDSSDSKNIWWEKDVNIIPSVYMYKTKKYLLNDKYRPWKITKLYVSSGGKMKCVGNHPNVLRNNVCMGDLNFTFSLTENLLYETYLQNCERLLEIINFDSAYHRIDDKTKNNSTVLNAMDKITPSKIKKIKEISFSDSDDIKEDEEESPQNDSDEEIIRKKNFDIIKYKNNKQDTVNVIDEFEENESIETYEIERSVNETIQHVSNDGSLTPVVTILPQINVQQNNQIELTNDDLL